MSMDPSGALPGGHHMKMWLIGIGAAIVLYFLLRSPGGSSGGGGTLYTTGESSQQAVSLAEAGMSLQAQLAQISAGKTVSLAGIAAAKSVANNQTTAGTTQAKIYASLEEALGKLQLQGLENTNATNLSVVKTDVAGAENINATDQPSTAQRLTPLIGDSLQNATQGFQIFTNWFKL